MNSAAAQQPLSPPIQAAWAELDSLAAQAEGLSDPNPRVACRLLLADGRHFDGHTQQAGGPHAEIMALRAAQAVGADTRGATALVTLEPCSHHGRTPPCADALIAAGIARIFIAQSDPNPLVNGQGVARLRAAGVDVHVLPPEHPAARAAWERNIGFFSRMISGRPWVRLKLAASLDGTTALANGASQWITGPEARADGHAWRRRASAVLTGMGTIAADDPRLDVRLVPLPGPAARQPLRVVIDSRLELKPHARIVPPPGQVLVFTAADPVQSHAHRQALAEAGVRVIDCPEPAPTGPHPKVDLARAVHLLARDHAVNELHIEAGSGLAGSFLRAGLVDELLLYLAPTLLGPGQGLARIGPLERLQDGLRWRFLEATPIGADLRIRARRA